MTWADKSLTWTKSIDSGIFHFGNFFSSDDIKVKKNRELKGRVIYLVQVKDETPNGEIKSEIKIIGLNTRFYGEVVKRGGVRWDV